MIPQKDGLDVPIPLLEPDIAIKTLEVVTNMAGTSREHVKQIDKGGLKCVSKLKCKKFVKPSDGGHALTHNFALSWNVASCAFALLPKNSRKQVA